MRMSELQGLSRRSLLKGATAVGVAGATSATGLLTGAQLTAARELPPRDPRAMWRHAYRNGVLYGSAAATWQLTDPGFRRLFDKHAAILFTQDDFLWYVLKPSPDSDLDFTHSDQIVEFAERNNQLVFGAHLVWDEGFGEGWTDKDLWDIGEKRARKHLFGTIRKTVRRYRGRVHIWSVANEVIVNGPDDSKGGLRLDVPWIHTIGPGYVGQAFRVAHEQDPDACLIMNDFGYETVNEFGDKPSTKRRATLQVLDRLLDNDVPVHGIGIQAHLLADDFRERFNAKAYRRFLRELSDRGMQIMITEMDVLDDGLPANPRKRDRMVADVYKRYLNVALDEPALSVVCSFGLSDRYTWLQEDYPRPDGAGRRPLFFNQRLRPKRSYETARYQFRHATKRWPVFETKRRFEG
jgi:endo-1,4-beta-xylanase